MLELYSESYTEVFDPADARVVALFYREDDAKAYQEWRNGPQEAAEPTSEQEWLGNTSGLDETPWRELDGLLDDVWQEVERLRDSASRYATVDVNKIQKFINEYRIRLGLKYGRITSEKARELLGVPEWAR